jgi:membrane protease YdiL (CAAX protease family)
MGPLVVYLGSLGSLIVNQLAGQVAKTFASYATLQILVFVAPLVASFLFVRLLEKTSFWSSVGLKGTSWPQVILFSLILNFVSYLASASLFMIGEYLTPRLPEVARYDPGAVQTAFRGLPRAAYWYMVFTSLVYAGFGEEVIFRGYILTRLLRRGRLFAILASAVMWSSLHLWYLPALGSTGIWQHVDVLLIGVLFGVAYVRMRSILPLIIVHAYTDMVLPLSFLYPGGVVDVGAFAVLTAGFAASVGYCAYWLYRRLARSRPSV